MAEVTVKQTAKQTVKQLASVVGKPVDHLLTQLREAGINVQDADAVIDGEQKRQLLEFLQQSQKIQLKKRTVSTTQLTASAPGTSGGKARTVVQVRKTRTIVRSTLEDEARIAAEEVARKAHQAEAAKTTAVSSVSKKATEATVMDTDRVASQPSVDADKRSAVSKKSALDTTVSSAPKKHPERSTLLPKQKTTLIEETKQPHRDKTIKARDAELSFAPEKLRLQNLNQIDEESFSLGAGARRRRRRRRTDANLQQAFMVPATPVVREVPIAETITVGELAQKISVKAAEVIKVLMKLGVMATINQVLDQDTAMIVVEDMGHTPKQLQENAIELELEAQFKSDVKPTTRAPVVTIMGHVDHGKTSLLDYIRRTKVTQGEAGGITQHIGAYHVETPKGMVTFLDTPGHAAFTAMRARGAKATDIVILVVAADDGVMPQTLEAIQHAQAAKVPIVVAINKMDKPDADPERIKTELSHHGVIPEAWGGDAIFVPISAKTGDGIDHLLDSLLVQSELLELTALAEGPARGVVVEARLDKGRGPVATVLVQSGLLRKGDLLLTGVEHGRVRAMYDEHGLEVLTAGPSMPVEVLGLSNVPFAGDDALVVIDERHAKEISAYRRNKERDIRLARMVGGRTILERMTDGSVHIVNIVLKADVHGSVEALTDALSNLSTEEVKARIVGSGVGAINESDASLALASHALLVGFNVRADAGARQLIEREKMGVYYHSVIYDVIDQVKQVMSGKLAPETKEHIVGIAQVRNVFRSPKAGAIAGCMVTEGLVRRHNPIRVLRDNVVIFKGELESLRRFKEDASEVRQGMECGIAVRNYTDVRVGDQIEVYETTEVARTL